NEWQYRSSVHRHMVVWLKDAPDVENMDWNDPSQLAIAKAYYDNFINAWNPRDESQRNNHFSRSTNDDPCLMDTFQIMQCDIRHDYEEI
ncbi:hypothetical protein KI387_025303, partial [Taxus chinensis]